MKFLYFTDTTEVSFSVILAEKVTATNIQTADWISVRNFRGELNRKDRMIKGKIEADFNKSLEIINNRETINSKEIINNRGIINRRAEEIISNKETINSKGIISNQQLVVLLIIVDREEFKAAGHKQVVDANNFSSTF